MAVAGQRSGGTMHGKAEMGKLRRAIGLMSGTSLDGIDVAFVETDGVDVVRRGPARTFAYDPAMRRLLANAISEARIARDRASRPGVLATAEMKLTDRHIAAVESFLTQEGIDGASIDVIGFHGQTVLHKPESQLTIQLGLGQRLAEMLSIPVVYDMRAADVAAGGQGAPLAPVYHRALVKAANTALPAVVVNIGGVANVTYIGGDDALIAFDCGPGNALLDDWMLRHMGVARDEGGAAAARGTVHDDVVAACLADDFFRARPPKSLDRDRFDPGGLDDVSVEDGAATLVAITVGGIAAAAALLPDAPRTWIVSGGGRHNQTIMRTLANAVTGEVVTAEQAGFSGDSVEAEAWAYMAVRSLDGLPLTFPGTTGIAQPMTGGILARPQKRSVAS